jgi:hypothetical protein
MGLAGCRGVAIHETTADVPWPYPAGVCPQFLVVYYPYLAAGTPLAESAPRAYGWTDQRMLRDIGRLQGTGAEGIVLALRPELIADAVQSERITRFIHLIEQEGGTLQRVVLLLLPPALPRPASSKEDVGKWLVTNQLQSATAILKQDGRVLLVLAPGALLDGPLHPAVVAVGAGTPGASWTWGEPAQAARLQPAGSGRQVLVYAGWRGRDAPLDAKGQALWELARGKGESLRKELAAAYAAQAGLICVSSWNDYLAGDFIEPNSLDGDALSKALTTAIREARQRARTMPVSAAASEKATARQTPAHTLPIQIRGGEVALAAGH